MDSDMEMFHSAERFRAAGDRVFLDHAAEFLEGRRSVPVLRVPGLHGTRLFVSFSASLLDAIVAAPRDWMEPVKRAAKYGFKGHSAGGRSGIFYLPTGDVLEAQAVKSMNAMREEVAEDLFPDTSPSGEFLARLRLIKVVSPRPPRKRMVGVYREALERMILLGIAVYPS